MKLEKISETLAWTVPLVLAICAQPAMAADCASVPGDWNWSIGAVITFTPAHDALVNHVAFGKWECTDPRRDGVTVKWSNGFVDQMTFAGDRASAKNQLNVETSGTRVVRPATSASTASTQGSKNVVLASGA